MNIDFAKASAMELAHGTRCAMKTVRPENVFSFPEGLLGFQEIKQYVFILNERLRPFLFMQALDKSAICFVCVESFVICPSYNVNIPDAFTESLEIKAPSEVLLLNLVTVRQKLEDITANLVSPLVINMRTRTGRQLIIENSKFPMRYGIWDALAGHEKPDSLAV